MSNNENQSNDMALFQTLCPEVLSKIFHYLTLPEHIKCGSLCSQSRYAYLQFGPVPIIQPSQEQRRLENVKNVPTYGQFEWRPAGDPYEGLVLNMNRDDRNSSRHLWVDAHLPIAPAIGRGSRGILFRFKMRDLRANGGYCSLYLARPNGEPGHLEIKFDGNRLRGYGGAATREDFGLAARTVRAGEWLNLYIQFDWDNHQAKLLIDGVLIKTLRLTSNGWDGIHSVLLRGYKPNPYQDYLQAWSHIFVDRQSNLS